MRSNLPILGLSLLFAACAASTSTSISKENTNPLTASRYGDELADAMAGIIIESGATIKQPGMLEAIQEQIERGKELANDGRATQKRGLMGPIFPIGAETQGLALYVDDMLYLSSDFYSKPGPSLHVYLTAAVDPRDVSFPDSTAIDLGEIQTSYGAQQFRVESQDNSDLLRTMVLWDTVLKRVYGFAQLSR